MFREQTDSGACTQSIGCVLCGGLMQQKMALVSVATNVMSLSSWVERSSCAWLPPPPPHTHTHPSRSPAIYHLEFSLYIFLLPLLSPLSLSLSLSLYLSLTLSHTHTLSHIFSLTHILSLSPSISRTLSHILSLSLSLSLSVNIISPKHSTVLYVYYLCI